MSCAAIQEEQESYLDDLWFPRHNSESEDRIVLGLICYLDDSGSDDGSPVVTCGGPLMNRINSKAFSQRWTRMYERNRRLGNYILEPPLHMTDFVSYGKYAGLYPEFKRAFFREVARLINEHKMYSLSVAVSQSEFEQELSAEVKKRLIGPYAFAFFSIVLCSTIVAQKSIQGPWKTAYLVDRGFGYQEQLNKAHEVIVRFQDALREFKYTGALDTDTDDNIPALQAADVISWTSRNKILNRLSNGFEPLEDLLREDITPPHVTIRMPRGGIEMAAKPINRWILENGSLPDLSDVLVRRIGEFAVRLNKS